MYGIKQFSTKDEVDNYFSGDKIQCLICGRWFCALATHLVRVHNVSVDEYKERYGLPWGHGLVADDTREKCAASLIRRIAEGEKSLMKTPEMRREIIEKAISKKKRPKKQYDIERIIADGRKYNANALAETKKKAVEIIEKMEKEKLPACYLCCQPGQPGMHVLYAAIKSDDKIMARYKAAKQKIPHFLELKTGTNNTEIRNIILSLRETGMTTREIAKEAMIGQTTVKRILRSEGKWGLCR